MTYSIVARDPATGQLGVAVQTCYFAVGSIVPWARAGVGAVATQAFAEIAYGPRCLDALAEGATPAEALERARAEDPGSAVRQVAVVGADGAAAVVTGELCLAHAGHTAGDGVTAQANMVASADVWGAMVAGYEAATGPLARRLLAALEAGEAAGGDARGRMSAALLVVEGTAAAVAGGGVVADVRVDRSDDPLGDLARLLDARDAFAGFDVAADQLVAGDPAAALATLDAALDHLPGDENLRSLRAAALIGSGRVDEGVAEVRALVAARPTWEIIVRGFAGMGLVPVPEGLAIDDLFR
jgi:uncharacterized Ntn-hydrolase superfamily protein